VFSLLPSSLPALDDSRYREHRIPLSDVCGGAIKAHGMLSKGTGEVKNCQYCDEPLQGSRQRKFCSAACYNAHRRQRASRSEKAKRNRREYLQRRLQHGMLTRQEFEARWQMYLEDGLI